MKLVAKLIIISLIILQIGLQADTKNFDIQNVKVTKYKSITVFDSNFGKISLSDPKEVFIKIDFILNPIFTKERTSIPYSHRETKIITSTKKEIKNLWDPLSEAFTFYPDNNKYFRQGREKYEKIYRSTSALFSIPSSEKKVTLKVGNQLLKLQIPSKTTPYQDYHSKVKVETMNISKVQNLQYEYRRSSYKSISTVKLPSSELMSVEIKVTPKFTPKATELDSFSIDTKRFGLIDSEGNRLLTPIGIQKDSKLEWNSYMHISYDTKSKTWSHESFKLVFPAPKQIKNYTITLDSIPYN